MIFIGMLTALLGIAIVLTSRSVTTFFHEMGHALPALLFAEGPVTVYVGSYGDISKSLQLKFGRLTIYLKFNFLDWNLGLCSHKGTGILWQTLIIVLGGPLMSLVVSGFLVAYMVKNGASENMAFVFGVFILSSVWDFLVNIYPSKSPYHLHDGSRIYSDGYQIQRLLRESAFPEGYFRAVELHGKGEFAQAATELENLMAGPFQKREAHRLLCESLFQAGEYERAENRFEEYYNRYPFQTEDYANLGRLFLKRGKYERALQCLETALHRDFKNAVALNDKGLALLELGHVKEAIGEFLSAIHYDPKSADAYRNLGLAFLRANQPEQALSSIQTALSLDPGSALTHFYLGKYFEKQWQFPQALQHFEKAREMGVQHHGIDFEIEEVKKRIK